MNQVKHLQGASIKIFNDKHRLFGGQSNSEKQVKLKIKAVIRETVEDMNISKVCGTWRRQKGIS